MWWVGLGGYGCVGGIRKGGVGGGGRGAERVWWDRQEGLSSLGSLAGLAAISLLVL